ncbi:MAG: alpha-glucosidase [Termitinemataceae bacterium]
MNHIPSHNSKLYISESETGFALYFDSKLIFAHSFQTPFVSAGFGTGHYSMFRGNFHISEHLDELVGLRNWAVTRDEHSEIAITFSNSCGYRLELTCLVVANRLVLRFFPGFHDGVVPNRWRCNFFAEKDEFVYGCGEQFSYCNLRGRSFPLWTSEQGVGRNKATYVTWQADVAEGAGGDYFWTFFPQTGFVSSRKLWYFAECSAYSVFDFTASDHYELYFWEPLATITIGSAESMLALVQDQSDFYGKQDPLPDWSLSGIILGIQGGTEICQHKLSVALDAGVPVQGIWAQDWEGINITSFGQRLRWNWEWDRERYPGLDKKIQEWNQSGIRFLGYINPYLLAGKPLFQEAEPLGYLAKNKAGTTYLVDFGEFYAGIVDLTNPAAFSWFKGVIKRNLLDFNLSGWMADFGEYLPTDTVLWSGKSAELAHNEWPALWARCNWEAVREWEAEHPTLKGQHLYFMRAGGPGSQSWCPLMWAGDQNVDWSTDDGLPSVIPAALSLALSGHGAHHSDIGGYTTLFGMQRSKELFMRWAELAAFTPVMRSHEGNRPKDNWQFDSDTETLLHLSRMVTIHRHVLPYLQALNEENSRQGIPIQRPLFIHFEEDPVCWTLQDQYLLGPDLLVAPVLTSQTNARTLHLPPGTWRHLWSGEEFDIPEPAGSPCTVRAWLGEPPVFYRSGSKWARLFIEAAAAGTSAFMPRPVTEEDQITPPLSRSGAHK